MSRVCEVTGKKTQSGRSISRRGLPKRKGGVGLKTTGITKRKFKPNTQKRRIWVPELNRFVTVKVCKKGLKTIERDGAYSVLVKTGIVKPLKAGRKRRKIVKS